MKALTCEMCGSTDIIKQDGVFVCQACGTKYSVEEAKKMMVEGTVSVKGVVTVDNSGLIDNYLLMASNAIEAGNQSEAENYCNKIIEINPLHSRAWFLKGCAAGWQSTLANVRLDESINCFKNALDNAGDSVEPLKEEVSEALMSLSLALVQLGTNHFVEFIGTDTSNQVTDLITTALGASPILLTCGKEVEPLTHSIFDIVFEGCKAAYSKAYDEYDDTYPSEFEWKEYLEACDSTKMLLDMAIILTHPDKEQSIAAYKKIIAVENLVINSCSWTYGEYGHVKEYELTEGAKSYRRSAIEDYHKKIQELDPSYVIPSKTPPVATPQSSGGCYVATAVYGSYDCPEVWTLRRYRDFSLAETWYGRAFIQTYYAISPTLVKWFGNTNWFKKMWKGTLDRMVDNLKSQGFESTPYEDRIW